MKNWEKHFGIVGCTKFVIPGIGEIDAKNEIPEDKLLKAYYMNSPYVVLTPAGFKKYYPDKEQIIVQKIEPFEPISPEFGHKLKKTEKPC